MEIEKSTISSDAKLSAIAGVMFFAPFIKNKLKSDIFSEDEKNFIYWYIQVWYTNLVFLITVLILAWLNLFWIEWVLSSAINILSLVIFFISFFSIFACANDLSLWNYNESVRQNIQHKWQVLKSYTPFVNFILWFRQKDYNMPYRWLKESILLRSIFIFWSLLLWNSFWMWVLAIIIIRVVFLLFNIDIIPLSIKKALNSTFSCNPWEIFAYLFAPIVSKIKKTDYESALQAIKLWYMQWQSFWIWIIIQYILFIGILFLLYRWINISLDNIVIFLAMILWIFKLIIFYIHKKSLLKIPILSEMTSLIFH